MQFNNHARTCAKAYLGVALALSGTLMVAPQALAEGATPTGSITITQRHNNGATYDAYQLFSADISSDDHATHIAWASDSMKTAVLNFLDSHGYTTWLSNNHNGANQRERAQNACEFITLSITGSATDTGAATTPRTTEGTSFANELARALAASNATPRQRASSGTAFTGPQGYYLFVTTDTTTEANGEAGTAPIWVPLGGSVTEIFEKSAVPSVDKEVREDSSQAWGKVADANTSQDLSYRLTGTLPSNYGAFSQYHYQFTDRLEQGLTIAVPAGGALKDALHVQVGNRDAAVDDANLRASYENNVLTVEFVNLKSSYWAGYNINKDTVITVEYDCHMNDGRAIGAAGNLNSVYLTYTDDPISNGDGRTDDVSVRVFAYKLSVKKVDEQTNEPLAGVGFTIRVADNNSDQASRGLYVQANGSLGNTAHEFTTDANGSFAVLGLDEGTYVLSEVTVPQGWEGLDEDLTLVVSSELEGTSLSLKGLEATLSGGDASDVNAASVTGVSNIDGNAGDIAINVTNDRWLEMPITGMDGLSTAAMLGAVASVGAGGLLAARRRRQ